MRCEGGRSLGGRRLSADAGGSIRLRLGVSEFGEVRGVVGWIEVRCREVGMRMGMSGSETGKGCRGKGEGASRAAQIYRVVRVRIRGAGAAGQGRSLAGAPLSPWRQFIVGQLPLTSSAEQTRSSSPATSRQRRVLDPHDCRSPGSNQGSSLLVSCTCRPGNHTATRHHTSAMTK